MGRHERAAGAARDARRGGGLEWTAGRPRPRPRRQRFNFGAAPPLFVQRMGAGGPEDEYRIALDMPGRAGGDAESGRGGARAAAEADYVSFWERQAARLSWFKKWDRPLDWNPPFARWFAGGTINASYNALDVPAGKDPSRTAIVWEGEDGSVRALSYGQLLDAVCRFANALLSLGVGRGDRVAVYLPVVPEAVAAMLACARIGAVHTVVFSGFSAAALRDRIDDSGAKVLVTADGCLRRGSVLPLKRIADEAAAGSAAGSLERIVVARRMGGRCECPMRAGRDLYWDDLADAAPASCRPAELDSAHPLFILYTSGTTGRPKGVLHGTGGYLVHVHSTFGWAFGPAAAAPGSVFHCTADIGWVTGHSYVAYGPLLHGATQLICEGAPDHPSPSRMWDMVRRHRVTALYTTPTALRMSMRHGEAAVGAGPFPSLRLLGSVGEPISPEVWRWYFERIGGRRCPVIDTWWQTETGGMMASALPALESAPLRPGSAGPPVPGVDLRVVGEDGREAPAGQKGHLVAVRPWPGMMLTLWGDDERYRKAYWSRFAGAYHAGDYAVRGEDGYLRLLGRDDDVLSIAGHRLGTAEIEAAIATCPGIAESAACGVPDEVKGEALVAFVVPMAGAQADPGAVRADVSAALRREIGPVAAVRDVHVVERMPRTRSGKIMRRLLRAMACGEEAGDTSTLEDGEAVEAVRRALRRGE